MLIRPKTGDTLFLYLGVFEFAVSVVMVRKDERECKSIYYTSKVLQRTEVRYFAIKIFTHVIIMAPRKIKPCFQAYQVVVLTNQPLKKIFHKPKMVGQMMQWCIELIEFRVQYHPRPTIKGPTLS